MDKKHDWIATLLYNNPSSFDEITDHGIIPDNVDLKNEDFYKSNKEIQKAFQDENGEFNETAFHNFYNTSLKLYNEFSESDWEEKLLSELDRDPLDWTKPYNDNIKQLNAVIYLGKNNPERRSIGIEGLGYIGDPVFSARELAQDNFVRDINGNKLNWTPNQKGGLFKSIFRPTLALASWDKDGKHLNAFGVEIEHKKGDLKVDENNEFYYEELGDRPSYDKDVLRWSDTITLDGASANKFDFLDQDGVDTSIKSTIAKLTFELAPLLIPGVGPVYGGISAIWNLIGVMPTFAKAINGMLGDNNNNTGKTLTQLESWFKRFDETSSDYGRSHFFSTESIGNIIVSSAKQLYQQKTLAKMAQFVSKGMSDKNLSAKVGQALSYGYLALTSSKENYGEFKKAGASDLVAGLAYLATTFGYYKLMDQDYYKKNLFKNSMLDYSDSNHVINNMAKEAQRIATNSAKISSEFTATTMNSGAAKNTFLNLANKLKKNLFGLNDELLTTKTASKAGQKFKEIYNRAWAEGFEEVSEEAMTDMIKSITLALEALGIPVTEDQNKSLNYNYNLSDILARYAATFIGGAIGGATFGGIDLWEKSLGPKIVQLGDLSTQKQLMYLLATGHKQDLLDVVEKKYQEKVLGNANIAVSKTYDVQEGDKTIKYYDAGTDSDNQNLAVYNMLKNHINYIDANMRKENLILQSGILSTLTQKKKSEFYKKYEKGIQEMRKTMNAENINAGEYLERYKTSAFMEALDSFKLHTSYTTDIIDTGADILKIDARLQELINTNPEKADEIKQTDEYKYLESQLKELRDLRDNLIYKDNTDKYIHQLLALNNQELLDSIIGVSEESKQGLIHHKDLYSRLKYDKKYIELNKEEQKIIDQQLDAIINKQNRIDKMLLATKLHYALMEKQSPEIQKWVDGLKEYTLNKDYEPGKVGVESITYKNYIELKEAIKKYKEELDELDEKIQNETEPNTKAALEGEKDDIIKQKNIAEIELKSYIQFDEENKNKYSDKELAILKVIVNSNSESLYGKLYDILDNIKNINQKYDIELDKLENSYEKEIIDTFWIIFNGLKSGIDFGLNEDENYVHEDSNLNNYYKDENTKKKILDFLEQYNIKDKFSIINDMITEMYVNMNSIEDENIQQSIINNLYQKYYANPRKPELEKNKNDLITQSWNDLFDNIVKYYQNLAEKKIILDDDKILNSALNSLSRYIDSINGIPETIITSYIYSQDFLDELNSYKILIPQSKFKSKDEIANSLMNIKKELGSHSIDLNKIMKSITNITYILKEILEPVKDTLGDKYDIVLNDLMNKILNNSFINVNLQDLLFKINELKKSIKTFDINTLFRQFDLDVDTYTFKLIDLIMAEQHALLANNDLTEYIINNPIHIEALKKIPILVNIIQHILEFGVNDFNLILNQYRKENGKQLLFESINENALRIITADLDYLNSSAKTLLRLHEENSMTNNAFLKQSEIQYKSNFLSILLQNRYQDDSYIAKIAKGFGASKDEWNQEITNLLNKLNINEDTDFKNFNALGVNNEFEKINTFYNEFGALLYQWGQDAVKTKVDIFDKICDLIDPNVTALDFGKLSDEENETIPNLAIVRQLGILLTDNINNFYSAIKYLKLENPDIVSILSQELNLQFTVAMSINSEFLNKFLNRIKKIFNNNIDKNKDLEQSDADYLKNREALKNFIFIYGGAGSGKTQVISSYTKKILELYFKYDFLSKNKKGIDIKVVGPTTHQLNNLGTILNLPPKDKLLKEDLLKKMSNSNTLSTYQHSKDTQHISYKDKINLTSLKPIFDDNNKINIIIIDEITLFNEAELKLISDWATKNKVLIIGLGDIKQTQAKVKIKDYTRSSGLEDTLYVRGTELTESIRSESIAQLVNMNAEARILRILVQEYINHPEYSALDLNEIIEPILNKYHLTLEYYEDNNHFTGTKIISEKSKFQEYINKFIELSKNINKTKNNHEKANILIIANDITNYSTYTTIPGVEIKTEYEAQGGEYDFVLVDTDFTDDSNDKFNLLKRIYTISSRAKYGSLLLNNGIGQNNNWEKLLHILNIQSDKSIMSKPLDFVQNSKNFIEWKNAIFFNKFEIKNKKLKTAYDNLQTKKTAEATAAAKAAAATAAKTTKVTGSTAQTTPPTTQITVPLGGKADEEVNELDESEAFYEELIKTNSFRNDEFFDNLYNNDSIKEAEEKQKKEETKAVETKNLTPQNPQLIKETLDPIKEYDDKHMDDGDSSRNYFLQSYFEGNNLKSQLIKAEEKELEKEKLIPIFSDIPGLSNLDYFNAVRLLSSAIIYNITLKEHHKKKIENTCHLASSKKRVEAVVDNLNKLTKPWVFYAKFDSTQNKSKLYCVIQTAKVQYAIPICFLKGTYDGFITVKKTNDQNVKEPVFETIQAATFKKITKKRRTKISNFKFGSYSKKLKICAPTETEIQDAKKDNAKFARKNSGKSYILWSECDILTDDDFDYYCQNNQNKDAIDNGAPQFLNADGMIGTSDGAETGNIQYSNKEKTGNAEIRLIGVQRTANLIDIYNAACILRSLIVGNNDLLNSAQRELLGNELNAKNKIKFLQTIIPNFTFNAINKADAEERKEYWKTLLKKLNNDYKLLSSNAQNKLISSMLSAINAIEDESKRKRALVRFKKNLLGHLMYSSDKSISSINERRRINKTIRFTINKYNKGEKIKSTDYHVRCITNVSNGDYDLQYRVGKQKTWKKIKLESNQTTILSAMKMHLDDSNYDIFDLLTILYNKLSIDKQNIITRDNLIKKIESSELDIGLETNSMIIKNGNLANDSIYSINDYDYLSTLLFGLDEKLIDEINTKLYKVSYFKNGFILNDKVSTKEDKINDNSIWANYNTDNNKIEKTTDLEYESLSLFRFKFAKMNFEQNNPLNTSNKNNIEKIPISGVWYKNNNTYIPSDLSAQVIPDKIKNLINLSGDPIKILKIELNKNNSIIYYVNLDTDIINTITLPNTQIDFEITDNNEKGVTEVQIYKNFLLSLLNNSPIPSTAIQKLETYLNAINLNNIDSIDKMFDIIRTFLIKTTPFELNKNSKWTIGISKNREQEYKSKLLNQLLKNSNHTLNDIESEQYTWLHQDQDYSKIKINTNWDSDLMENDSIQLLVKFTNGEYGLTSINGKNNIGSWTINENLILDLTSWHNSEMDDYKYGEDVKIPFIKIISDYINNKDYDLLINFIFYSDIGTDDENTNEIIKNSNLTEEDIKMIREIWNNISVSDNNECN